MQDAVIYERPPMSELNAPSRSQPLLFFFVFSHPASDAAAVRTARGQKNEKELIRLFTSASYSAQFDVTTLGSKIVIDVYNSVGRKLDRGGR